MNTLSRIAQAFDSLQIPYLVGGSLASGAHGIGRTTFDVDILAAITAPQAEALAAALGNGWYVDVESARSGIPAGRSFNIIHMESGDKFDIFPAAGLFHRNQLRRAVLMPVEVYGETMTCPVASAEDILLAKLQWFRDGGEVSERQWADIKGIVANNPDLDVAFAREWAEELGIAKVLERALNEAPERTL